MLHLKEATNLASQNVHTDLAVLWPLAICSPFESSCFGHSFPQQIPQESSYPKLYSGTQRTQVRSWMQSLSKERFQHSFLKKS